MHRTPLLALALVVLAVSGVGSAPLPRRRNSSSPSAASGGLCPTHICHWGGRITTTTISADGRRSRRITAAERLALTRAITQLQPASLPPFAGTCPIAYDGQELSYRFRGKRVLRSCTYDLRHVKAVQLVDRLLASLPSR